MKPADIRSMSVDQVGEEVDRLRKEAFNLRFQKATGQLANTARVRQVRRDIARLTTIASQDAKKPKTAAKAKAAPKKKTKGK